MTTPTQTYKIPLGMFILSLWLMTSEVSMAQLSVTNLMETQLGNTPDAEPSDMLTLYNQFNIRYRLSSFDFFIRTEQYHSSIDNEFEYFQPSRFGINYRNQYVDIKVGHFYETLGRGLLLRGYEIPGSIYEGRFDRARQAFYKDMQGASATMRLYDFKLKLLAGRTLQNQLPPLHDERRNDEVAAGELSYRLKDQELGLMWLSLRNPSQEAHYAAFHLGGSINKNISYYSEFAKKVEDEVGLFDFSQESSYGGYISVNYARGRSGVSLELKDYHNFIIGSGIADPPTLVKEHSYHLLNRSTHVSELYDESGFQIEAFTGIFENNLLTFNHARARNDFGTKFDFQEYFLELSSTGISNWEYKAFMDYSSEDLLLEKHRMAGGGHIKQHFQNNWSAALNFEYQRIIRGEGTTKQLIDNTYTSLIFSRSTKFIAAIQMEVTNDAYVVEDPSTGSKFFPAINLSYRPIAGQTIQLFAGERRGGTACTAGICYEVLAFKGVELRWTSKF